MKKAVYPALQGGDFVVEYDHEASKWSQVNKSLSMMTWKPDSHA